MENKYQKINKLLFKPTAKVQFLRIIVLIAIFYPWFKYICIPEVIKGKSMMPTYPESGFTFCWTPAVWNGQLPKRQSVVVMKYKGRKVMLLKRLIAFGGETVQFYRGKLYVDGYPLNEPYVKYPCNWTSKPITLKKNEIYVIGDNRNMKFQKHIGGVMKKNKLLGVPVAIW